MNVIIAMTKDGGIGLEGKLPWKCKQELSLFKRKTLNSILVMGRKTVETLPLLQDREIWCVTRNEVLDTSEYKNKNVVPVGNDWVEKAVCTHRPIFIAGGSSLYNELKGNVASLIDEWHISIMKKDYKCDTFVNLNIPPEYIIVKKKEYTDFTEYVYAKRSTSEKLYLSLLERTMKEGKTRQGRNGETKSVFGPSLHFDLTEGFPLLTTKKMYWRGIVEELLFFLRGETDTKKLEEKKVNIWRYNTERKFLDDNGFTKRKEGMMGPMYGFQWRNFGGDYNENTGRCRRNVFVDGRPPNRGIDQLKMVVNKIKNDPHSRRIIMTDYNPSQARDGVLYPCHSLIVQFYVDDNFLDMTCYNRSSDLFLGLPFNIASSALLLTLIALTTGKTPRHFYLNLGDAHIYKQHYHAVTTQLKRIPMKFPTLRVGRRLNTVMDIESLRFEDFELVDYISHSSIKAEMVA